MQKSALPLVVDLDGTLIKSDTFWESLILLIKQSPRSLFFLPLWLLRGKAYLKDEIAKRITLDPHLLPYEYNFLQYLAEQKKLGRQLILATAANKNIAQNIAAHLGIFDKVLASDAQINLSGVRKLAAIQEICQEYAYAGNHRLDLFIWQYAKSAVVMNASAKISKRVKMKLPIEYHQKPSRFPWRHLLHALRPYQLLKNLLLVVPLITAFRFDPASLFAVAKGFIAFSCCAASVYLCNDILDIHSDRQHPLKKNRAFAGGYLSIISGVMFALILLTFSIVISLSISPTFSVVLISYFLLTFAYSLYCKKIVILDAILLTLFYVIRVIAGGVAINVRASMWLLGFSLFIFLSLAFAKRYVELKNMVMSGKTSIPGRGYQVGDQSLIMQFGISSSFIAVLIFGLYVNSAHMRELYQYPPFLWLACPLWLYWLCRLWLYNHRGQTEEDPLLLALKDKTSYVIGLLLMCLVFLAK